MARPRREIDAALQRIYDRIPTLPDCTGACWRSCGPIEMSQRERQRISQAGYRITPLAEATAKADTYWCEALTADRRCAVYDLRPVICRLWGAVEGMPCLYGCRPQGGYLTDQQGLELIIEAGRVGGGRAVISQAEMRAVLANPQMREVVEAWFERGRAGDQLRAGVWP
jgi:Fe-S-cluster containining protein